ncbi:2-keto-3-deoxygluconate permease (TC 2.A.10.1.1) [Promicromonospora umidemergens]|uniref:2-keto-3-deoxygluconate permease n=1 Tax=Promicromonospora umidemergens TaxID=629679 RepID=A0ABP8XB95_9MICO|nr:2-keto-3-deoxygluconate permease [Promicromonospora umidemergens]MCP2281450.1 2-keto-3-deoxygluconate permease (TC 2.A.10.1.1) [Promicromonospora umidemergens]
MDAGRSPKSTVPLYDWMNRVPGGLMLIPLVLGSVVGTFFPGFLELGSFTTALFKDSALPLIAVLIFATGMQITARTSGPVLATTGTLLLTKSLIPAALVALAGSIFGIEGFLGVSILALMATVDNSNGGLWLAFTGKYGDERDRGAYMASALNDGPFISMLFLGASGLADIPLTAFLAAIIPLALGFVVGNLDPRWTEVMRPVPNIVIPFFAFALGTGINLRDVVSGGASGILVGVVAVALTAALTYSGYRFILRRGIRSGIAIASATTAGNAVATPAIIGAIDPAFEPYVAVATAQVASAVLVSAILAPLLATIVLKRQGGLTSEDDAEQAPATADEGRGTA